jgi:hypothetical protein
MKKNNKDYIKPCNRHVIEQLFAKNIIINVSFKKIYKILFFIMFFGGFYYSGVSPIKGTNSNKTATAEKYAEEMEDYFKNYKNRGRVNTASTCHTNNPRQNVEFREQIYELRVTPKKEKQFQYFHSNSIKSCSSIKKIQKNSSLRSNDKSDHQILFDNDKSDHQILFDNVMAQITTNLKKDLYNLYNRDSASQSSISVENLEVKEIDGKKIELTEVRLMNELLFYRSIVAKNKLDIEFICDIFPEKIEELQDQLNSIISTQQRSSEYIMNRTEECLQLYNQTIKNIGDKMKDIQDKTEKQMDSFKNAMDGLNNVASFKKSMEDYFQEIEIKHEKREKDMLSKMIFFEDKMESLLDQNFNALKELSVLRFRNLQNSLKLSNEKLENVSTNINHLSEKITLKKDGQGKEFQEISAIKRALLAKNPGNLDIQDQEIFKELLSLNHENNNNQQQILDQLQSLEQKIHNLQNLLSNKEKAENQTDAHQECHEETISKMESLHQTHVLEIKEEHKDQISKMEKAHGNQISKIEKLLEQKLDGLIVQPTPTTQMASQTIPMAQIPSTNSMKREELIEKLQLIEEKISNIKVAVDTDVSVNTDVSVLVSINHLKIFSSSMMGFWCYKKRETIVQIIQQTFVIIKSGRVTEKLAKMKNKIQDSFKKVTKSKTQPREQKISTPIKNVPSKVPSAVPSTENSLSESIN